jgi:hypothetical protein
VRVRVAQVAQLLLQALLVRIRIAVQAEEVDLADAVAIQAGRGGDGCWQRGPVGVLVGIEEDIGAVVLVVAGQGRVSNPVS